MATNISTINRVIAHKIIAKTRDADACAVCSDNLLQFANVAGAQNSEQSVLTARINKAINNPSKSFELVFNPEMDTDVYSIITDITNLVTDDAFIHTSKMLADRLADSQTTLSIPSGYCIVCDGTTTTGHRFLCIIKADYQEVFNIQGNTLMVISDVFLSPAREFYKIGMFVFNDGEVIKPIVYDDQFSAIKTDLTKYFYADFLGLKTSDNDIIQSKAFYADTAGFISSKASFMDPLDIAGLQNALNAYYRENVSQVISAHDVCERHLAGTELAADYTENIVNKYPRSFTLRSELLEKKMNLQRIGLSSDVTLLLRPSVHITANITNPTQEAMQPYIDSGRRLQVVVLESDIL